MYTRPPPKVNHQKIPLNKVREFEHGWTKRSATKMLCWVSNDIKITKNSPSYIPPPSHTIMFTQCTYGDHQTRWNNFYEKSHKSALIFTRKAHFWQYYGSRNNFPISMIYKPINKGVQTFFLVLALIFSMGQCGQVKALWIGWILELHSKHLLHTLLIYLGSSSLVLV